MIALVVAMTTVAAFGCTSAARAEAPAEPADGATPPPPGQPGDSVEPGKAAEASEPTAEELEELRRALGEDAGPPKPGASGAPAANGSTPPRVSAGSMNPEMSLIFDAALGWFSSDEPAQLGAHDPNKTGFTFQQLELHAFANVDPFFRFDANLVFSQFGVEVEEAYATTLGLPGQLQVRAGQFLTRFGRKNATHPHSWSFLDQPLVLGKFFGGESGRGLGIELSWLVPVSWYLEVVGSMNDAAGECCARSMLGGRDLGVNGIEDFVYSLMVKQFWDLGRDWGLNLGLSVQTGPNASGLGNRTLIGGLDLYLRWRPRASAGRTSVDLTVEVMARARELPGRNARDVGGFAELRWLIDQEWAVALRHEAVSGLQDDPLDPEWTETRQRSAVVLDFYPSHFSRLRLQLGADDKGWEDEVGLMALLGLEVVVGAHGSHGY